MLYSDALEYDLMTRTRFTLDDVGKALSWRALLAFIAHLDKSSALWRAANEEDVELAFWESKEIQPQLLAGIIDELRAVRYVLVAANSNHKPKPPKPIERPFVKAKNQAQQYGSEPVSITEFEDFWSGGGE